MSRGRVYAMTSREPGPIVDLGTDAALTLDRVGGKAACLARLRRLGFDVPPGFVVTTDVDRVARAHGGLLPQAVRRALIERWRASGWSRVAVRSSAVLEDREEASLAGQLETVLDVRDEEGLVRAVEQVLASVRSERVRTYLARRLPDVDPEALLCACLIQPLLDPECAGVAFTLDPARGLRDRIVVECVPGRGDVLVSGAVQPERHEVSRPDLAPVASRPARAGEPLVLSPAQLRAVAEVATRIESALGAPQDIEWAISGGGVVVLQARPVTQAQVRSADAALSGELARLRAGYGSGPGLWSNLMAAELLPCPTLASLELLRAMGTPGTGGVFLAYEHDLGLGCVRHGIVAEAICGRLYADVRSVERIVADLGLPLRLVPPAGPSSWTRLERRFVRVRWIRLALELPRLLWRAVRAGLRIRALLRDAADRFVREDLPGIEAELARSRVELERLGDDALLEALDAARRWCAGPGRRIWERGNMAALLSFGILAYRTRRWLGDLDGALATALVRGVPGNLTLETNDAIAELAELARSSGEHSQAFEAALARFLSRFGHRATTELELSDPRWREDPAAIRAAVARLVAHPTPPRHDRPPDLRRLLAPLGKRRRRALRRAVETARRNAFLRETPKFHYLRRLEQLRALHLEVGRRAAARGELERAEDVFHLSGHELAAALAGRAGEIGRTAAVRRTRRDLLLGRPLPSLFRWEHLEEILEAPSPRREPVADDRLLRGEGVSPGRVRGRARIVLDPSDARALGADAVLVAPRTDPGWTPLFLAVRALVVETGSAVSHAAIVAREYGLPTVVNVPRATARLADGANITVDGTEGWVRVEDDTSSSA